MFDFITSQTLAHLIATDGYAAILLIIALESMGLPLPGEATLIAAALYAGTTHHLSIALVIAAAAAGAILGDNLGYLLGRLGGARLLHRYGRLVRLDERKLRLSGQLFGRHGTRIVFFGRFMAFLRMWAAFLAGTYHLPWRRFLVFNAAGGIVWAGVMGLGSDELGGLAARAGGILGVAGLAAAAVVPFLAAVAVRRMAVTDEGIRLEVESVVPAPAGRPLAEHPLNSGARGEHEEEAVSVAR
ncbi:MAG TPA: VTT domain-containing protein [Chloroflexota bacterium]|nr:VTT domain-containing protein [Chloroflexota bacterium]